MPRRDKRIPYGVSIEAITIIGFGETHPAKQEME
jgi:hypothetical protein